MATRANSKSFSSLMADVAVLNPKSGVMEFPSAKKSLFPASQSLIEYKRKEWEWEVKHENYDRSFEEFFSEKVRKEIEVLSLSKEGGSPERIAELEEIRKKSKVNFVVYRGQDAFEVLDSKKAEEAVKKSLGDEYNEAKRKQKYVGAVGDGLYHTAEDAIYASSFGPVIIEGVVDSKHLLDIRELAPDISRNYRYEKGLEMKKQLVKEREKEAELDRGIEPDINMGIRYAEIKSQGRIGKAIEKNPNSVLSDTEYPLSYVYARRYANQLVSTIAKQYEANFGKKMPLTLGMTPKEKKEADISDGTYRALKTVVAEQLYKLKNAKQWNVLKTPFFKQIMKESGFDAIAYNDWSFGGSESAVAFKNPNQFKSYFGNKKVNPDSPNIFDAD